MAPLIPDGSRLRVTRASGGVRPGDVVVFLLAEEIVAHRVVSQRGPLFRTKGDSSPLPDPPAWSSLDFLGRVVSVERQGRSLELGGMAARTLARMVAAWSALLGWGASCLPTRWFTSRALLPRAVRLALRIANRALPAVADLALRPFWERAGGPTRTLSPPPGAG